MNESNDFTNVDDDGSFDDFQELLDGIQLSPVVPGKRGRGVTNNTGADVLGVPALKDLLTNHHVDFFGDSSKGIQPNSKPAPYTLYGIIDAKSVTRAEMKSQGIEPGISHRQTGILAVSLAQDSEKVVFLQMWRGNIVNGVLSFTRVYSKSTYKYVSNPDGIKSFWKVDTNGKYTSFNFSELVFFKDYLNAIVTSLEVPVSFPVEEVSKMQGLSEILANVNVNTTKTNEVEVSSLLEDDEDEDEE